MKNKYFIFILFFRNKYFFKFIIKIKIILMEDSKEINFNKNDKLNEKSSKPDFFNDRSTNVNPIEYTNNIINPYQSQYIPRNNGRINNNMMEKSSVIGMKRHHHRKKILKVNLTEDEEIYFHNLFVSLDIRSEGKLDSRAAADFLKKSGLSRNILKTIWLTASKSSITHIEKEEFYAALRLIALAQNNFPYTEEAIEKNSPIPPLPNFKYKIKGDNEKIIYKLSENNKITYKRLFDNNKEKETDEKLPSRKAIIIWKSTNASDELIRKVAAILTPLEQKGHFNLKEFQVGTFLIYINDKYELPNKLPLSLVNYLGRNNNAENDKINNGNNNNTINSSAKFNNDIPNDFNKKNVFESSHEGLNHINITNNNSKLSNEESSLYIAEILKKADELKKENEIIEEKIISAKNKINYLYDEINGLQNQRNIIQDKLKFIDQECSILIDLIAKNKNAVSSTSNNENTESTKNINIYNNNKNQSNNEQNSNTNSHFNNINSSLNKF